MRAEAIEEVRGDGVVVVMRDREAAVPAGERPQVERVAPEFRGRISLDDEAEIERWRAEERKSGKQPPSPPGDR